MPEKKKCKQCGTEFTRWNTIQNTCSVCMNQKLNQKPLSAYKPVKRTPLKKVSSKRKDRLSKYSEKDLFFDIWQEREHNCNKCGKYLVEAKAHNFSHIKSKGSRPDLRLEKSNIEILCFRCHFKKDMGMDYKGPDLD